MDAALGGEHHAVAELRGFGQHLAQELLGLAVPAAAVAPAVDVGGVDQVHVQVERRLRRAVGLGHVGADEVPAPERQRPDLDVVGVVLREAECAASGVDEEGRSEGAVTDGQATGAS